MTFVQRPVPPRPGTPADLDVAWALNQAEVPAVGDATRDHFAWLADQAAHFLVVEDDGAVVAFVIALGPGVAYSSPNYGFFAARHDDFLYVDRIVVSPAARGRGLARGLYEGLVGATEAPVLCAEVNVRPRNDVSLAFHGELGFVAVGEQETYGGSVRVRLLERALA